MFLNQFVCDQGFISIRAPIAQKTPAVREKFISFQIYLYDYCFVFFFVCARYDLSGCIRKKCLAKESHLAFAAWAVPSSTVNAIGYGMAPRRGKKIKRRSSSRTNRF